MFRRKIINTKLLPFCFSLCLGLTTASAFAETFNSLNGYSLTLPPGWHILPQRSEAVDVVANFSPKDGLKQEVSFNAGTDTARTGRGLQFFKTSEAKSMKKGEPGMVIKSQTSSSVGGVPDVDLAYSLPGQGSVSQAHQAFVVKNKKVYTFTMFYNGQTNPKYDAMFEQILSTVHWKK